MAFIKDWFKGLHGNFGQSYENIEIVSIFALPETQFFQSEQHVRFWRKVYFGTKSADRSPILRTALGRWNPKESYSDEFFQIGIFHTEKNTVFMIVEDRLIWVFYEDNLPLDMVFAVTDNFSHRGNDMSFILTQAILVNMTEVEPDTNMADLRKRYNLDPWKKPK